MLFNRLVVVTLTAAGIGFATTVSLAFLGFGPNSMAIGAVATNVITGMGAWLARTDRKLLMPGFSEWRALLNWGGQSAAASVVTTISMDINDLVLGKVLGFAPVAMISRAQGLMNLFHRDIMAAIRNVAYPAFSRAHREGVAVEPRYIDSVTNITVIAWPFYGFVGLFSLEILRLMFGPQWDEAAPLVKIFCLAGAISATSSLILSAVLSIGRIDLVTKAELIFQPVRAALIVAAALIFESLLACAIAYLIAFVIHTPFMYFVKGRCLPNDFDALLPKLWLSFKVTVVTLLAPMLFSVQAGLGRQEPTSYWTLMLAVLVAGASWLAALIILKHPVTSDPLFIRLAKKLQLPV